MLYVLFAAVLAMVATLPSVLIAKIWLQRQGIQIAEGESTVPKFMEVAPTPIKAGLIALNFVNFSILCGSMVFLINYFE